MKAINNSLGNERPQRTKKAWQKKLLMNQKKTAEPTIVNIQSPLRFGDPLHICNAGKEKHCVQRSFDS